jgi:CheY-like chemotaxis protein
MASEEGLVTDPGSSDPIGDTTDPATTVLYIEDDPSNRDLIEGLVSRIPGVRLLGTDLGRLGVVLARTHLPSLVLLDVNLPDISGHEVLALLKADPVTAATPVIVLSAHDTPSRVRRTKEEGALAYFSKPLDMAQLLEVIDDVLHRARTHAG